MQLHLIRHGPKNNNPDAHGTGVEALLDPDRISWIQSRATGYARGYAPILIETTPVSRAKATGEIFKEEISISRDVEIRINESIGSYALHPHTNEAINLSPQAMSHLWAERKEKIGGDAEHQSLYAWCEQGFDNLQANNPDDLGISLREIACRLGKNIYQHLTGDIKQYASIISIGHSGDIEPFLYLCLEMLDGKDGTAANAMTKHFHQTGGALEPLQGLRFFYDRGNLSLEFPLSKESVPRGHLAIKSQRIGIEILQQQAQWTSQYGKSQQVLEQKIAKGI